MRFVRESTFPARSSTGGVDFYPTPFGDLAGPLVDAPAGFAPYPDLPGVKVAERTQVRRFLVQSGAQAGVGNRLAVHDRCAPVRFASDDGSGPLNPVPVETRAAAAHLIRNRLAVASTPPASPPAGGVDGAAGPDVDAPGIDEASPAASAPGMVGEQSRPGGPPPELEVDLLREAVREMQAGRIFLVPDGVPRWYERRGTRGMGAPLAEARPDLAACLRRAGVGL